MRHALPICAVLALVVLLAALPAAAADAPTPDPKIKAQLDALGYQYEVDKDGDFSLVFEQDNGRTQLVYVRTPVETYGALRIREIWSPGYQAPGGGELPAAVANRLLADSNENKLGGWTLQESHAVFVIKLDAGAGNDALRDAIEGASATADQMEAALTPGKDDF